MDQVDEFMLRKSEKELYHWYFCPICSRFYTLGIRLVSKDDSRVCRECRNANR